jgi:estrogen-related receptor ERR
MTTHPNVNGVIVSANIKSELIDNKDEDQDCGLFVKSNNTSNASTTSPTILTTSDSINANSNNKLGLYSRQSTNGREGDDSVSSITTITTISAINANASKLDFVPKSQHNQHNSLDLYSTSGSLEQSPSSSPLSPSENHAQDMFCSSTMSGDCSSNTSVDANDAKTGDNSPKRVCLVCGDTASGFHYGVASCEACKAFFKRTIQGNIEYTCPASNDCEINKRRRKACQACRFQKCLRMGMLKEGVRLDRVRGGRQKYRRSPESPYHVQNMSPLKKSNIEENKMVSALLSCEPEPLLAINSQQSNTTLSSTSSSTQYKSICILSDLVDRELVATIGWAKQIPGFTDLILNDQMRLLQTTWAEVLSLSLAFRSHQLFMPSTTTTSTTSGNSAQQTKLVFANDFIMDDQQASQCRADELFSHSIQLVKRLNLLKIAKEEYLLLKAMLLTNAGISLFTIEITVFRTFFDSIFLNFRQIFN